MLITYPIEIYRAEPARRRECLYYLALGYYKLGNYEEANRFNGMCLLLHLNSVLLKIRRLLALLLDKEPTNLQAQSLASLIDKKVTRGELLPVPRPL